MMRYLLGTAVVVSVIGLARAQDAQRNLPDPTETRRVPVNRLGVAGVDSTTIIPPVLVKGIVMARGRPGIATLEVSGQLVRVRKGTTFTFPVTGPPAAASAVGRAGVLARVVAIAADEVSLELPALGQTVVLR